MTAHSGSGQEHGPPVPEGHRYESLFQRVRAVVGQSVSLVAQRPLHPWKERARAAGLKLGYGQPEFSWLLWWIAAGLLAVVLLALNVGFAAAEFDVPPLIAIGAGIGQSAALLLVLVHPTTATALQFLSVTVLAVAIPPYSDSTWPLTVTGMLTLVAHVGLVAARTTQRAALATWWTSALLLAVVVQLGGRGRSITDWLTIMIIYPSFSATVLGAVLAARRWGKIRQDLDEARRDVKAEQSQRAVAEERTRIARELHDVVAHSMSVIYMQATSASYRIAGLDGEAKAEFARIATDARSAIREMRQLLAVLRDESADPDLTPVPTLGRLAELVESAGRAGVPVEVRQSETVRAAVPPDSVALAAYRIIQESLSNVIRHAPGARTTICLDLDGVDLVLSVVNDAAARPTQPIEAPGRATHGLPGMRERARLVGGSLETGARDQGGYRVAARLPIGGYE